MSHLETPDHRLLRRAWDRFCATGEAGHLDGIPARIAGSWQRSRSSGVDPGLKRFPVPEPIPIWTPREQELKEICATALRPFLDDVHDASILLTVSETSGRTVLREGNATALSAAEAINSVPGALIGEAAIGTNSVGTTLFLRDAVHVDFLEHFCEGFQDWADIGVPILHPLTGELVGAVDFAVHRSSLSRSMTAVAKTAARTIQSRLLEKELRLHHDLLKNWGSRTTRTTEVALAVDRNGVIVALTDAARAVLKVGNADWQGRSIDEFAQLAELHDRFGPRDRFEHAGDPEVHVPMQRGAISGAVLEPVAGAAGYAGAVLRLRPDERKPIQIPIGWSSQFSFHHLVGASAPFRDALDLAIRVARTDLPVLIQGETGTGKEMFAHAIHAAGARAAGPFVTVNCGAIPADLIGSELFGYEKGAFTGANSAGKRGKFEQAEGGTIFLDEITETSALLQVNLLRVLQDGIVVPLGSERPRKADIRIIAAANADFAHAMAQGGFRQDLYYRLKGVSIQLPALRDRPDDIPVLVRHFCEGMDRPIRISDEALQSLVKYPWPGNVRELHAVIKAAVHLSDRAELGIGDLPPEIRGFVAFPNDNSASDDFRLSRIERDGITRAMAASNGNATEAAKALGIARSSLYRKLRKLHLKREASWNS